MPVYDILAEELAGWLHSPRHFPAAASVAHTFNRGEITSMFIDCWGAPRFAFVLMWYIVFPAVAVGTVILNVLRLCDWGVLSARLAEGLTVWLWNTYLLVVGLATVGLWLLGARQHVSWQQRTTLPGSTRDSLWLLCSQAVVALLLSGKQKILLEEISNSPLFADALVLLGYVDLL